MRSRLDIAMEHIPSGIRIHRDACIVDDSFRPDFWAGLRRSQHEAALTEEQLGHTMWWAADFLAQLVSLEAGTHLDLTREAIDAALGL